MQIRINKNFEVINEYVTDKEVYATKIVDELPSDINEYYYKYMRGSLVKGDPINFKEFKLKDLEVYYDTLKNIGVKYDGKWFKCDDDAQNNLLQSQSFITALLPLTWFTRNGEDGVIVINTMEEWIPFMTALATKIGEIKNKYYAYKYAIEQCTTKEELDAIIFEMPVEETDPITEEVVEEVPAE